MVGQLRLARIEQAVTGFLQQNRQMLTDLLVSGTRYLVKVATGLVLMVFLPSSSSTKESGSGAG